MSAKTSFLAAMTVCAFASPSVSRMTSRARTVDLDIGGTKTDAGMMDCSSAELLASPIMPTEASRGGGHVLLSHLHSFDQGSFTQ